MPVVSREVLVEQSVQDFARAGLLERGFTDEHYDYMEAWDQKRLEALKKNTVVFGFNADESAREVELGSALRTRPYNLEFIVLGTTRTWAKTLANALRDILDTDGVLPLKDVTAPGQPVIDALEVVTVTTQHEPIATPEPWQRFVWTVRLQVEDTYDASL